MKCEPKSFRETFKSVSWFSASGFSFIVMYFGEILIIKCMYMYILPAAFLFCAVASVTQTAHGEVIGNDNLLAHLQVFFHSWSQTNHGGTGAHKTVSKWKKTEIS